MDARTIDELSNSFITDYQKGLITQDQLLSLIHRLDRIDYSQSKRKDPANGCVHSVHV